RADAGARSRGPHRDGARVAGPPRPGDDRRRVDGGRGAAALVARARRRPLAVPGARPRRPAPRPRLARAAGPAARARADRRAGAPAGALRPVDRGETRAPARADHHAQVVHGPPRTAARLADDARPGKPGTV